MTRKYFYATIILFLTSAVMFYTALSSFRPPAEPQTGIVVSGKPLPDFSLVSQDNQSFSLQKVAGRPVILFFGYTSCPDVCPLAMRKIAESLKMLGPKREEFAVIFITVDPARDTPSILAKWVSQYYPGTIALTGEMEGLSRVWRAYGAANPADYESAARSGDTYYISHSAVIYVADRNHVLRYILTPEMDTEAFRQVLEEIYQA
ncbi:MAG: SCO family protein [Nitrososphaerota archaeon]